MLQSGGSVYHSILIWELCRKIHLRPRRKSRHQPKNLISSGLFRFNITDVDFSLNQVILAPGLAKECDESITALVADRSVFWILDSEPRLAEHFKPNHLNGPQLGM